MGALFLLLIIAIFAAAIYFAVKYMVDGKKQTLQLKEMYENALKSGDKQNALQVGRRYYSSMRGGELSIYDEQAIANDLSAMKERS
ncbi:MAG: hypothetical protein EOP49_12115 [Sphingobacteriales bacterium]|nr:MAG: hypothetical protein EOP49_12115 [Sphingobacteriales bacterium]